MRPSAEARFGLIALVGLQLMTSLGGVALLGRMSPAVERILTENVYSTEAVEEMLFSLAAGEGDPEAFHAALERARSNITEVEEFDLIDIVEQKAALAVAGDGPAKVAAAQALRELGEVNRASMTRADREATQLGLAGAWAMSLLGVVAFLVSLVVWGRLQARLLAPVLEVDAVLSAVRAGDSHRRCAGVAVSLQGGRLLGNLNWLLDRRVVAPEAQEDPRLRAAVVGLVDRWTDRPVVLSDGAGALVAVNASGLELLRGAGGPAAIAAELAGDSPPEDWARSPLPGGLWLGEGPAQPTAGG
ncbi:MAG: hypothetical protein JXX28_00375 [Deltaproteobacteria bacterium]|nr:hypothetical protein [Deltaproteobacteria bacterium]